jgi:5,10-methylenetetrahydromethanopterin reductase
MDGTVRTPMDASSRDVAERVYGAYDMRQHTRSRSPQAAQLTAEFVDRFGIVGPPDHCVARLRELLALGIDRVIVVGPSVDADREAARIAVSAFARDVLPALKEAPTHAA